MGKRILVTGASGLIGSHLVSELKKDHEVVSLIHNCPVGEWQKEALKDTIKVKGDVRDFLGLKHIMARHYVDRVIHLAAIAQVKSAFKDPLSVYDVNVMGTVSVLEACKQLEVERILIMQTDKVYGEKLGATESDPYQPSEPYATSKVCQGFIAWSYANTFKMDVLWPHGCNAFGYDPFNNRIFPNTIKACIRGERPLIYTNDKSIREYIYVDDLVGALKQLLLDPKFKPGPYNIATGWVKNQEDIVKEVLKHFPDTRPRYVKGDLPTQIQQQTMKVTRWSWQPERSFDDAVERTIALFQHYEEDWN